MATTHVRAAARKALADYLATQVGSGVAFFDRFPPPGTRLLEGAMSVMLAPAKDREHKFQPVALSQTAIPGDNVNALILYSWGIVEFGLQLDVFAEFQATRDALVLQVEDALNRPPGKTLGTGLAWQLDLAPGLVLQTPDNFDTPTAYRFEAFPGLPESGRQVQAGEYRQTWMGSGTAHLLRQVTGPLIKKLTLLQSGTGISGTQSDQLYPST